MCKSERGFSVAELLITTAIVSVMLAGAYQSFLSSSKRLVLQNQIVEMQTDARAAMDFMVRELRLAFDNPTITTKTTANDTITFNPIQDSGYASARAASTLSDNTKNWTTGQFNKYYTVRITSGTGAGQTRSICDSTSSTPECAASNNTNTLTISGTWATNPDTSSFYVITRNKV